MANYVWPGITEVWEARAARTEALLRPLAEAGITATSPQRVSWVGDLQQGDGGKGAMVDRLAATHQVVVRTQGGDNAGHTSVFTDASGERVEIKNHLIPSGLRHPNTVGLLGNGVLVNADRLRHELEQFEGVGESLKARLFVSDRAHLVLPLHLLADSRQENHKEQSGKAIGTTRRGIGPANASKVNRIGVRVYDLFDMDLVRDRIRDNVEFFGLPREEVERNLEWVRGHRDLLLSHGVDSRSFLAAAVEAGYSVLAEGAQGPLIDLEHGIYPYVTTSPTTVHSVATGSGLDAARLTHRVGVLKCYQTMVGNGAFVSEDHGAVGDRLREQGREFGTTTSRPRRCGWLDLVHARWAAEVNEYTSVVLTKLDVLDDFEEIGLCVGYELDGDLYYEFKPEHQLLEDCKPVYAYFPGWRTPTTGIKTYEELPPQAKDFVEFIQAYLGVQMAGVTKGPGDDDMLIKAALRGAMGYAA
ncbi:adenylosuccinate synthase [Streptomyces sp. NPDC041068]|uniref:adenylosuccinate synthase n=1 Tax=Streptomyces sp. NPDC041068 TaxID=3155130 RepID=UPI0033DA72EB